MASSRLTLARQAVGTVVVAALSAGIWLAWFGWDDAYQTDPVTGQASGPYQAWQAVGAVGSLLVLQVGALLARIRPVPTSIAVTLGFVTLWTVQASDDGTGLYLVGAILLAFGFGLGTTLVSVIVVAVRAVRAHRSGLGRPRSVTSRD